ncbi:methyltransferase domain-containing protein [bacterium]|nr:methyltransferase domain-containing protein [bacterium]
MHNPGHAGIDRLFADPHRTAPFRFDDEVAAVFDDMISRSVPHYDLLQALMVRVVRAYAPPDAHVLDMGCSTGTTLCALALALPHLNGLGIDSSPPFIAQARHKAQTMGVSDRVHFDVGCLPSLPLPPADVMVASLVLQFLPVADRAKVLVSMRQGIRSGGLVVVVEKTTPEHPMHHDRYEHIYHDMKQSQGYSQVEIQTKKKALEGVLVPLTRSHNEALFREAGFVCEPFFTWMVFSGWVLTPC